MARTEEDVPMPERRYPIEARGSLDTGGGDALLAEAMGDLWAGRWAAAEQSLTSLLASQGCGGAHRAAAIVGVAQSRLIGRLDARGAFAMLHALLRDAEPANPLVGARMHVIAGLLFATPDDDLRNRSRSAAHVASARRLLRTSPDANLSALAAVAELFSIGIVGDPHAYLATARQCEDALSGATSPVAQCLALEVRSLAALAAGDLERTAALLATGLDAARAFGFSASEARFLWRQARSALDRGAASAALALTDAASDAMAQAGTSPRWLGRALDDIRRAAAAGACPRSGPPEFRNRRPTAPPSFAEAAEGVRAIATSPPDTVRSLSGVPCADGSRGDPSHPRLTDQAGVRAPAGRDGADGPPMGAAGWEQGGAASARKDD